MSARLSKLDRYFGRPVDSQFDDVKYCEQFEQYMVAATLPRTAETSWRDSVPGQEMHVYKRLEEMICRINLLYPSSGDVF